MFSGSKPFQFIEKTNFSFIQVKRTRYDRRGFTQPRHVCSYTRKHFTRHVLLNGTTVGDTEVSS